MQTERNTPGYVRKRKQDERERVCDLLLCDLQALLDKDTADGTGPRHRRSTLHKIMTIIRVRREDATSEHPIAPPPITRRPGKKPVAEKLSVFLDMAKGTRSSLIREERVAMRTGPKSKVVGAKKKSEGSEEGADRIVTTLMPAELVAQIDAHAARMSERVPGFRASRADAVRSLVIAALAVSGTGAFEEAIGKARLEGARAMRKAVREALAKQKEAADAAHVSCDGNMAQAAYCDAWKEAVNIADTVRT